MKRIPYARTNTHNYDRILSDQAVVSYVIKYDRKVQHLHIDVYIVLSPLIESALARRLADAELAEWNCLARRGWRNDLKTTCAPLQANLELAMDGLGYRAKQISSKCKV